MSLIYFTRQLAVLLNANVPLVKALDVLGRQSEEPDFERVVEQVATRVGGGQMLSSAMLPYSRIFSTAYVSLIKVGESSGTLTRSLERLADWQENEYRTASHVRSAMTYPIFVLATGAVLMFLLFSTVLPNLLGIFDSVGGELPWLTRLMIWMTHQARNPLIWLLMAGCALELYWTVKSQWKTPEGSLRLYRLARRLPGVGPVLHSAATARLCGTLSSLLEVGMTLLSAWKLSAEACASPEFAQDSRRILDELKHGTSLAEATRSNQLYPRQLVQMLQAGEDSSRTVDMLDRLRVIYEQEVEYRVQIFTSMLEPMLLLVVASAVGVSLLAVVLPLYGIIGKL